MKKTISFAIMHFSVAFTVAYLLTGSFVIGGLMAAASGLSNCGARQQTRRHCGPWPTRRVTPSE